LQTELEHTKERFENCIIKKETEYAKLWNDWYKKCDECKYDKISYDKAYKDMQQKIERLQAQLGVLKGKCKDTSCVSDTQNQLSQKLENANVELEFRVFNYARENAYLKATYKNLFDSISVSRDSSKNTKFAKQPNVEILSKIGETNTLLKPVTSNSVSAPRDSKGVNNAKVIALGMFRISPDKISREAKKVPNTDVISKVVCAKCKKCLISVNHNVCLNYVNGRKSRGPRESLATPKPRKPRFLLRWSPTGKMFDQDGKLVAPSNSESHVDCSNGSSKHMIGNLKLLINFVWKFMGTVRFGNDHVAAILGFGDLQWSPTGRLFDQKGKIVASSESESQYDCSNGDNACTSNNLEPKIKWFPNSTSLLGRLSRFVYGALTRVVPST
nr:integrase, catalytic region, zinc finger, CCHC-type, peptidase aspartic, catalytic [Tanacetum cinerariifolium]